MNPSFVIPITAMQISSMCATTITFFPFPFFAMTLPNVSRRTSKPDFLNSRARYSATSSSPPVGALSSLNCLRSSFIPDTTQMFLLPHYKKEVALFKRRGCLMKISELTQGTGNVEIEAEIVGIEDTREINKMGRNLRVANATIRDDSGTMTLVLWNDAIDKVREGSKIKITNGYVNTWQSKLQLTLGKFGKMEVL
ncbi:hypothetical protein COT29_00035 [Candidatus Micrarchaeota archaeon CG08_land_8_20_14_0_20_59_11]|nr:MAG: hypothetical protein COT29_00035 [Candidatus Micrarchaeota archaeon CG08_land_8_20_14_0_20_59_11]